MPSPSGVPVPLGTTHSGWRGPPAAPVGAHGQAGPGGRASCRSWGQPTCLSPLVEAPAIGVLSVPGASCCCRLTCLCGVPRAQVPAGGRPSSGTFRGDRGSPYPQSQGPCTRVCPGWPHLLTQSGAWAQPPKVRPTPQGALPPRPCGQGPRAPEHSLTGWQYVHQDKKPNRRKPAQTPSRSPRATCRVIWGVAGGTPQDQVLGSAAPCTPRVL